LQKTLHPPPVTGPDEIRPHRKESATMKQLTEDQFDAQFTVVPDTGGDSVRNDYEGIDRDSKRLWTIVDADGSLYAVSGVHFVNRFGYIVTEEAWTEDIEAVWHLCSDDDEDTEDTDDDDEEIRP
jgi:hypothetical protein